MATVNDVVKKAYRKLNVVSESENLTSEQLTEGLSDLNDIIDSLNTERLIPYYVKRQSFTLTASQNSYTIGSGGDFNTTRPLRILKATITKDSLDYPMRVVTYDDWMDIYNKSSESEIPSWIYYESDFPLGKIYLNYTPSETNTLNIATENQIGSYTLGDTFTLPPAYKRALVDLLALELYPKYPSEATVGMLKAQSDESMDKVRRLNFKNVMVEAELDRRAYPNAYSNRRYFWNGS